MNKDEMKKRIADYITGRVDEIADDIVEDLTQAADEIESLNKQKKILNDDIRLLQKKYYLLIMDYKKFFEANRPGVKFDAPEMNIHFTEEAKRLIEEGDND